MSRVLLPILLAVLLGACTPGLSECDSEVGVVSAGAGDHGLRVAIVGQKTPRSSDYVRLGCMAFTGFDPARPDSTLFSASARLVESAVRIEGLPDSLGAFDLIVSHPGHFPVKAVGLRPTSPISLHENRLLLYPVDSPVALAGQLVVNLRPQTPISHLESVLGAHESLEIIEEPGGFRLKLDQSDRRVLDQTVLRLANQLALQAEVISVGPAAIFGHVY